VQPATYSYRLPRVLHNGRARALHWLAGQHRASEARALKGTLKSQ